MVSPTTVAATPQAAPAAADAGCPIAPVIDIVFSRWTTPILWQLHTHGRQRFNDLKELAGGITANGPVQQRLRP